MGCIARKTAFVVSALICVMALAVPGAQAAEETQCSPFFARSGSVDQDRVAGVPRLTEYMAGGAYRVTLCDQNGVPIRTLEAAPHMIAGIGIRHVPSMEIKRVGDLVVQRTTAYPKFKRRGKKGLQRVRGLLKALPGPADPDRIHRATKRTENELNADDPDDPLSTSAVTAARKKKKKKKKVKEVDTGCKRATFSVGSTHWKHDYVYYIRPDPRVRERAYDEVIAGHEAWNNALSPCGKIGNSRPKAIYGGRNGPPASSVADGINTVDVGNMDEIGCPESLACTVNFTLATDPTTTVETDMRFNEKQLWSHTGEIGRYDVRSVATHEAGHAIAGLNDMYGPQDQWLTMYGYVDTGRVRKRTLGRGDLLGLQVIYP